MGWKEQCIECGAGREAHHEFYAPPLPPAPDGCACAESEDWDTGGRPLPAICAAFKRIKNLPGICADCEHERACHRKKEVGR